MTDNILSRIRSVSDNLKNAIIRPLEVDKAARTVGVTVVTDRAYTPDDKSACEKIIRECVPPYFGCRFEISKLSPDCEMVRKKIMESLGRSFKAVYSTISEDDIKVEKTDGGFYYTVGVAGAFFTGNTMCDVITAYLKNCFCGEFSGNCVKSDKRAEIEIEEDEDEIEFELPVRTFKIRDFEFLEGQDRQSSAIYMSDMNLAGDSVVVCGEILEIRDRTYTNKKGQEKEYLSLVLNDTTATVYATYFVRQRSADKIHTLKAGDYIVCTGKNEEYRGNLRFTAEYIDYGKLPENFTPEKRASKPVPKFYHTVKPEPYSETEQTDLFRQKQPVPDCLKQNTFVVFDLETTGLNSSPVAGNMDKIIEIAAYKIKDGVICESFTTFVNPERRLSEEIIKLTGITEDMLGASPTCEKVLPDFFKFCAGSILVGHNIAGFDFKFVDYYCGRLGYILERKIIDTIPLSQEQLFLSNYKLNTVADKFGITFNHHRAADDALVTAKIFIELIKLKKSLPKLQ